MLEFFAVDLEHPVDGLLLRLVHDARKVKADMTSDKWRVQPRPLNEQSEALTSIGTAP